MPEMLPPITFKGTIESITIEGKRADDLIALINAALAWYRYDGDDRDVSGALSQKVYEAAGKLAESH